MRTKAKQFTPYFEWCEAQGDGNYRIGITDFAQQTLGEIVYLELPIVGDKVEKDCPCCFIESKKSVVDILAPLSGVVTEVNSLLLTRPNKVNQSPYGEGWLLSIRAENHEEWLSLSEQEPTQVD